MAYQNQNKCQLKIREASTEDVIAKKEQIKHMMQMLIFKFLCTLLNSKSETIEPFLLRRHLENSCFISDKTAVTSILRIKGEGRL